SDRGEATTPLCQRASDAAAAGVIQTEFSTAWQVPALRQVTRPTTWKLPARHKDAEEAPDLAARETALLVQFDAGGLGHRGELGRRLAATLGRWQRATASDGPAAPQAVAEVPAELARDHLRANFDLVLRPDMRRVGLAVAVGAGTRQSRLVNCVDML